MKRSTVLIFFVLGIIANVLVILSAVSAISNFAAMMGNGLNNNAFESMMEDSGSMMYEYGDSSSTMMDYSDMEDLMESE